MSVTVSHLQLLSGAAFDHISQIHLPRISQHRADACTGRPSYAKQEQRPELQWHTASHQKRGVELSQTLIAASGRELQLSFALSSGKGQALPELFPHNSHLSNAGQLAATSSRRCALPVPSHVSLGKCFLARFEPVRMTGAAPTIPLEVQQILLPKSICYQSPTLTEHQGKAGASTAALSW